MAASQPGQNNSRFFFLTDHSLNMCFLVDTGAEVSVIIPTRFERQRPQIGVNLRAANNTVIATYGTRSLTLNIGLRRVFRWVFMIADVKHPTIGANFLQSNQLLVDVHRKRLVDTSTKIGVHILDSSAFSLSPTIFAVTVSNEFDAILTQFPELTRPYGTSTPVKHNICHRITTTGSPLHSCT